MGLFGSIGSFVNGIARDAIPGVGAVEDAVSHVPGLQGITDFLGNHGGDIVQGLAGVDALRKQQAANATLGQAKQYAQGSYDARSPLRAAGMEAMLHPQTPSLAAVGYNSPGNAYGHPATPSLAPVAPQAPLKRFGGAA